MTKARVLLLGPALALGLIASAGSCGGGTSAGGGASREMTAGSPSAPTSGSSSGGVPVQAVGGEIGGTGDATGGSKPVSSNPGGGAVSHTAGGAGGSPGGDGGADTCAEPAAPGCFSCCEHRACPADSANCDGNPSDCETPFGATDGCTPKLAQVALPSFGTPVVSADGSYFVVGPFFEVTDFDPGSALDVRTPFASQDAYVSKFSADGKYLWTYTFGKRVEDVNAAPGQEGSVVVAGAFARSAAAGADPVYTDPFIIRLDADGKPAWQHVFKAVTRDSGGRALVATDGDGKAVLAAYFGGDIDFGLDGVADLRHFPNVTQGFLFEFDVDGSMTYSQAVGGDNCYFYALDLAVSRTTIVVRASAGIDCVIDGKPLGSHQRDYWPLVTFTRRGVLKDAWLLGGVQRLSAPLAYDDGSVIVSGMFTDQLRLGDPGTVIAGEQTRGSDFMLRFSKESRLDWVKIVPVSGHLGPSIARTPDNGVVGTSLDNSNSQLYLVSWRADGTPAWTGAISCQTRPLIVSNGPWFILKTDDAVSACDLEPGSGSPPANGAPYWVEYHF